MSKYVHTIISAGQTGGDLWLCIIRPTKAKTPNQEVLPFPEERWVGECIGDL